MKPPRFVPFDRLDAVITQLILSARRLSRLADPQVRRIAERDETRRKGFELERRQVEAVFYSGEEDDPITLEVESVIAEIERTCRNVIDSRGTLPCRFLIGVFRGGARAAARIDGCLDLVAQIVGQNGKSVGLTDKKWRIV
jgi:hypothetical protein